MDVRLRVAPVESAVSGRGNAARRWINGLHRRFCLWSLASRGTRECPGLVLGLDRGGACRGVALRLPAMLAIDELHLLWRREMAVGSYHPRWVKVDAGGREIVALTFVVRREHPQYAGRLSLDEGGRRARAMRAARSAPRSTTSSARASRWSRTASSTRISNGSRAGSARPAEEKVNARYRRKRLTLPDASLAREARWRSILRDPGLAQAGVPVFFREPHVLRVIRITLGAQLGDRVARHGPKISAFAAAALSISPLLA